ncbi:MAG: choice-of-anchor Q domain-containing protein [Rhodoglobus sp.]
MTFRSRAFASAAVFVLALGGALVIASPASAASLTVTDPGDTNTPGTLRWALNNLAPGGPNTITFLIPGNTITAATALPTITESVIINGPGESALTIDSTLGTVFSIAGGAPNIDVTISDLTISSPAVGACGISSDKANLTVTNLTASDFDCSGIAVTGGSLTATDVTVENDASGIAFQGSVAANSLSLTRVHAGGAAFTGVNAVVTGATATVTDVDADDAQFFGLYLAATDGATASISGVRADRSGAIGITVLTDAGATAAIDDSSSDDGVGQGIDLQATDNSSLTATGLTSTHSGSSGLWLSVTDSAALIVQSSLVQDTVSNSGIWIDRVDDAALTIRNTQVLNNTSTFGGGIFVREATGGATVDLSALTVTGNHSDDDGGGIDVNALSDDGTVLTLSDSTISNNTSVDYAGGLYLLNIGGGVTSTAHVVVLRTTFDGNHGGGYGGAIAINEPARETSGQPTVLIDSSTISNNVTPYGGGGIQIDKHSGTDIAVVKVLNTTISGNDAQVSGGIDSSGPNLPRPPRPGRPPTPFVPLLSTIISHSTIAGNSAHTSGGVAATAQSLEIDNSIIAGSTSNNGQTPDDLDVESGGSFIATYSLIQNPKAGVVVPPASGNLVGVDPQLAPLANNGGPTKTRFLTPASPAYNAGDPAFVGAGLFDQRGQPRVSQRVDMGAVEWQPAPAPALALTGGAPRPEVPLWGMLFLFVGVALVAASRIRQAI